MSSALTLVVLIVAGDAKDPVTMSMKKAAEETLGPDATVLVRDAPRAIENDDAVGLERSMHADAIAEVSWREGEPRRALVHLHVQASSRWIDREIGFASSDAPAEEGRTIGFAVASMLPERPSAPVSTPREIAPSATAEQSSIAAQSRTSAPRAWTGAIDASVALATSLGGGGGGGGGGAGGGVGGALGVEWYVTPHFALRGQFGARYSEVTAAQATLLVMSGGAGIAWRSWTPTLARRYAFGARIEALAVWQAMRHLDVDDPSPVHQSRWVPGADAIAEGSWLLTEGASVVVGVGAEVVFGNTDVLLHQGTVATLTPVHPIVEAGIRARF
jgi:hypothetical protein